MFKGHTKRFQRAFQTFFQAIEAATGEKKRSLVDERWKAESLHAGNRNLVPVAESTSCRLFTDRGMNQSKLDLVRASVLVLSRVTTVNDETPLHTHTQTSGLEFLDIKWRYFTALLSIDVI